MAMSQACYCRSRVGYVCSLGLLPKEGLEMDNINEDLVMDWSTDLKTATTNFLFRELILNEERF